jgi:DNA-binding SARP family transcriptional activator
VVGAATGPVVLARTGGWPLAVALSSDQDAPPSAVWSRRPRHVRLLAEIALRGLDPDANALLVALARLPRFPDVLLTTRLPAAADVRRFAAGRPTLVHESGGWWFVREWLRDALAASPADPSVVMELATTLVALDEGELAARLLIAERLFADAVPVVERLAADGLRRGRAMWVRSLLAELPEPARTLDLELSVTAAAQSLSVTEPEAPDVPNERRLLDLVARASAEDPRLLIRARALLANHYRMAADGRVLVVCEEALGEVLTSDEPELELAGRVLPDDAAATAEMLRYYGLALVFSDDGSVVERGRRLVGVALGLLDRAGRPTASIRAWFTYFEALVYLRSAADAVRPVRLAAHQLADAEHSDAAVRLAELATLEFLVDDHAAARRTIELARDHAERTGNRVALVPLSAIEVGLDAAADGASSEHERRLDDLVVQLLADPPLARFAGLIAAEFGVLLVRRGHVEAARRCLGRAERVLDDSLFTHVAELRCRRLRALVQLDGGSPDAGRAELQALRRDAEAEGRCALVDLVVADLTRSTGCDRPPGLSPLVVHVLGPELVVTADGEPVPSLRGYSAKLLALLVATDGSMTLDAAVEALWPGASIEAGRNRLHGVLLRLRRGLGLSPDGPVSCVDGMVRLRRSPEVEVDAWEFARAASGPSKLEAIERYRGDVLTVQFAYDDTIELYRRELRRTFLRLARAVLADPPSGCERVQLGQLARRASQLAPEDEELAEAAVAALVGTGHLAEADELVRDTMSALTELGVDAERFRRRVAALTP